MIKKLESLIFRHPDKTSDPTAESRFVEIKQAYELLSDPDKRYKYDQHGITDFDTPKIQEYTRFQTHPFEDFFSEHGKHFNFQENDITFFHKMLISARYFTAKYFFL